MSWFLGVVLVLGVMILVHEWGHFAMARLFKVRVDVFSIGFGPRLFGWKRLNFLDYKRYASIDIYALKMVLRTVSAPKARTYALRRPNERA